MNLLSNRNVEVQKKYVTDAMRKNKIENIEFKSQPKKIKVKKTHFLYGIFAVLVLISIFAVPASKISFTASADKLNANSGSVLGESTAPSPGSLMPKIKRTTQSAYETGDKRMLALKKFLEQKGSPLASYSDVLFDSANNYGIDYRLVASIAGAESNFCKFTTIRLDSELPTYNCWGWGKNGKKFAEFSSWPEAIKTVSKGISQVYGPDPTPKNMQDYYCQSCRGTSTWQELVGDHMKDIDAIANTL